MNGKLEKMLILAFESAEDAEGIGELKDSFEALINPEFYHLEYKTETPDGQADGTCGKQVKFGRALPTELTFEFLFDNTGIIDGRPNKVGVILEVNHFRDMLIKYRGNSHEPYHLVLIWGSLLFKCRAVEVGITYKLFNPDGLPIRATVKAKFKESIEEKKRVAKENRNSPDLTHQRKVKAGDTLPLMCHRIYGDPKYYFDVARANDLSNFRSLKPGTNLIFPPLQKTETMTS